MDKVLNELNSVNVQNGFLVSFLVCFLIIFRTKTFETKMHTRQQYVSGYWIILSTISFFEKEKKRLSFLYILLF